MGQVWSGLRMPAINVWPEARVLLHDLIGVLSPRLRVKIRNVQNELRRLLLEANSQVMGRYLRDGHPTIQQLK